MKMKVKTKRDFDGKVSNIICHRLNELCEQKRTKAELLEILNSSKQCYLNEIGRKYMLDKSKVLYASACYLLVLPKEFVALTGEQLYVWLYRDNVNMRFGSINLGVAEDFEYAVVRNYYTKIQKNIKKVK